MTPHFITPCYCRIEDADKRKEIYSKLEAIGRDLYRTKESKYIFCFNNFLGVGLASSLYGKGRSGIAGKIELEWDGVVDCGTNTDLFLALASMREDTNEGQWFVAQSNILFKKLKGEVVTASKKRYITIGEMFMPLTHNLRFTWFGGNLKQLFRLATATEIIEHFNNK